MTVIRSGRPNIVRRGSLSVVCEFPDSSADRKSRRTKYTGDQRDALEAVYNGDMYPSTTFKRELAGLLQLTNKQVQIWFQNRRSKDKLDAAAAGLPVPSRRRNSNAHPPVTPISSSSSSSFQRSYTDGSLHTLSSSSSQRNVQSPGSPTKPSLSAATSLYPSFPLLPPVDLSLHDESGETISEDVLASLQSFPPASPTYDAPTPALVPATSSSDNLAGALTPPASSILRTLSMPAPMTLPAARPVPRRHATSGLIFDNRAARPPLLSFQSFTPAHRLSAPMSAPDVRPSTSAGFSLDHTCMTIDEGRPITSAGLVTISPDRRPETPPATMQPVFLASPIAIRGIPSGLSLTRPQSSPKYDVFNHRGNPSPVESEGAPSEWSSASSYRSDLVFTNLHASSMPNLPLPHTPAQTASILPLNHFAPFSPTHSIGSSSSPTGSSQVHSFPSGFLFDCDVTFDPSTMSSLEDPAFGMPDLPMMMPMPDQEVDFEQMMEDLTTPSASRANIPPDWSSAFAHIALEDEQRHPSHAQNAFPTHETDSQQHQIIPAEQSVHAGY